VRRAAWVAAGLGAACCFAAPPARAAISAQIPAECGSLSAFEAELEQRLGTVSAPEATRVTLTPEVSGYQLVVEVGSQRRELHDASCQELLRAAIVITLALLEPKAEAEAEPPALAESASPSAPPSAASPASSAASSESTPRTALGSSASSFARPQVAFGAGGGVHVGTLPRATLLLEFDVQLQWRRFGGAAGFRYLLPTSTVDENGRGARIGAVGAYLAGVYEPWPRLQTRVGIAAYRFSATGLGTLEPRDGSGWELAPTLGASFTAFARPPFWAGVGVEGQLNLIRPSFEILKYNEVFHVPPLSGSALARAGVVF